MKSKLLIVALILHVSALAQTGNLSLQDALRLLPYSPVSAKDSLIKMGFIEVVNIGHPWKRDQTGHLTVMRPETGAFITVSPRPKGKGCELLVMYNGAVANDKLTAEMTSEGFKKLSRDVVTATYTEEAWYWEPYSLFGKGLFVQRQYAQGSQPDNRGYNAYIHYNVDKDDQFFDKRERETAWTPGTTYRWKPQAVQLLLPKQAQVKPIPSNADSIHITWAGGDWSAGPVYAGAFQSDSSGNGMYLRDLVKSNMKDVVRDRNDSLILKIHKDSGLHLFIIESDGIWMDKPFVSSFFAFSTPGDKIIYGHYTSLDDKKGKATRKTLRQALLATYKGLFKTSQ